MIVHTLDEEDNARNQLTRADHLIFVTLKYTRTVDIIKSIVKRLLKAFDYINLEFLEFLKKQGKGDEVPTIPKLRCEILLKIFPNDEGIKDYVDFYNLLRKIDKAEYTKKEEYRKNVTLVTEYCDVNIETVHQFYDKVVDFYRYVQRYMAENQQV